MEFLVIADVSGPDSYHVGDEAMLEANIASMRSLIPGVAFTVVSKDPEWTRSYYQVESLPPHGFPESDTPERSRCEALLAEAMSLTNEAEGPRNEPVSESVRPQPASEDSKENEARDFRERCRRLLEALRRSDGLVISGGGNLCSTWPHHLYERVALMLMAHRLGKPIAVLGQTLGPHLEPREHSRLSSALRLADIVVTRERFSYDLALQMGIDRRRLLYSLDDAFFLRERPLGGGEAKLEFRPNAAPWIGVTFSTFVEPARWSSACESLAGQLGEIKELTGAALTFIPQAGEVWGALPDSAMGKNLAGRLNGALRVVDLYTAPEVRWLTGQAAMIISNRYHPLIFGLAAGAPCLGLYSDEYTRIKIQGALAHAGLADWSLSVDDALSGGLAPKAARLWRRRAGIRSQLLSKEPEWTAQEKLRWRRVLEALGVNDARDAAGE